MRIDGCLFVLLLASSPIQAAAQASVPLRYAPAPTSVLSTVTEIETRTTVSGLPAIPDGAQFERHTRLFARQSVVGGGANGWLVDVSLDSMRTRWRPAGGAWRDDPPGALDGSMARVRLNERFAVTGVESSGERDAEVLRALTGWMGGLGFAFPEAPVPVGTAFDTGSRLAFMAELSADSTVPLREMVVGDLALRLDSVTDRGVDSLQYFAFTGAFVPRDVRAGGEEGDVQASLSGAFAGRLIWSTGWDGFVAGTARIEVRARATGAVQATVDWHTTISHRVRP